ncbi:MAG: LptA/OstA family protein [bacterium]
MVGGRFLRGVAAVLTCAAVILSLGTPGLAQQNPAATPQGPIELTADHIEYDSQTGDVVADGHVVATRGGSTINADHLTGNLKTGDVLASGHVVLTQPGKTATGTQLKYNYRTQAGEMTQAVAKSPPWTVTGQTMTTAAGQGTALWSSATPCDPRRPAFRVTARKVFIVFDNYLKAYDAILYVYGVPIMYVPVYTVSLRPGRGNAGPTVGYDNFNGYWAEYTQYIPIGDWTGQVRIRDASRSGWSGEGIVFRQFPDYLVNFHFGRAVSFDQNGNQFNLDQDTVDVTGNYWRIPGVPLSVQGIVQTGTFYESESGIGASRTEEILNFMSDTFKINPRLNVSAAGYLRYDAYGTGQLRDINAASAAMTQVVTSNSSATLAYNYATVHGTSPFLFDAIGTDSTLALSYSYYPGGLLADATISDTYDFIAQQTTYGLYLTFTISPSVQVGTNIQYNYTLRQLNEIDYVVNLTCDCLSLGVLYQTFPNSPQTNQWYLTLGINTLPGVSTQMRFGPR